MAAIRNLCQRAMFLSRRRLALLAEVNECIAAYDEVPRARMEAFGRDRRSWIQVRFSYKSVSVNVEGQQPQLSLRIDFVLDGQGLRKPAFVSFDITDNFGVALMQALPVLEGFVQPQAGRQSFTVMVDLPPLVPGQYWVSPWVGSHNTETFDMVHQCVAFEVHQTPTVGRTFPHHANHGHIVPPSRLELAGSRNGNILA